MKLRNTGIEITLVFVPNGFIVLVGFSVDIW